MKHGPHNKQRTIIVQLVPVYKKKTTLLFTLCTTKTTICNKFIATKTVKEKHNGNVNMYPLLP